MRLSSGRSHLPGDIILGAGSSGWSLGMKSWLSLGFGPRGKALGGVLGVGSLGGVLGARSWVGSSGEVLGGVLRVDSAGAGCGSPT